MTSVCDSKSTECLHEVEIKDNITIIKVSELYVDELTEEQQKMLKELEEAFAYRYTNDDKDYVATKASTTPPLVSSYNPYCNQRAKNRSRKGFIRGRGGSNVTESHAPNEKRMKYDNDCKR